MSLPTVTGLEIYRDTSRTIESLEEQRVELRKRLKFHEEEVDKHRKHVNECLAEDEALAIAISQHRSLIKHCTLTLSNDRPNLLPETSFMTVRLLPSELFNEIFLHFLEGVTVPSCEAHVGRVPTWRDIPQLVTLKRRALLMSVCRRWRGITLSNPTLWRTVTVWDSLQAGHWERIETRLKRAVSSLLRIECIISQHGVERIDVMLTTLLPRAMSLSLLYTDDPKAESLPSLQNFSGGRHFQDFSIRLWNASWATPPWMRDLLRRSRPLRTYEIDVGDVYRPKAALGRVQCMSLGRITVFGLVTILRNAPRLQSLTVARVLGNADISTSVTKHLVLADLIISSSECAILEGLAFPSLRRLTLGDEGNIISWPSESGILQLCRRSKCSLTSLTLHFDLRPLSNSLAQILEAQPNLYSLVVHLRDLDSSKQFIGLPNSVLDLLSAGALVHLHTLRLPINFEQLRAARAMLEARLARQDSGVLSKMLECKIEVQAIHGVPSQVEEADALRLLIDEVCGHVSV